MSGARSDYVEDRAWLICTVLMGALAGCVSDQPTPLTPSEIGDLSVVVTLEFGDRRMRRRASPIVLRTGPHLRSRPRCAGNECLSRDGEPSDP